MAVKFTKGQICNGTISKNICHKEYNLHGKFHTCFTKCTIFVLRRSTMTCIFFKKLSTIIFNGLVGFRKSLAWMFLDNNNHTRLRMYNHILLTSPQGKHSNITINAYQLNYQHCSSD